jgi:DNA-binding CsgD family transcriptional regulator
MEQGAVDVPMVSATARSAHTDPCRNAAMIALTSGRICSLFVLMRKNPYTDDILRLADGSRTGREIAAITGCKPQSVYNILWRARRQGIAVGLLHEQPIGSGKRGSAHSHLIPRNAAIAAAVSSGETLAAVGERYGLTRERIRQIARRAGVQSVRAKDRAAAGLLRKMRNARIARTKLSRARARNRRAPSRQPIVDTRDDRPT